MRKFLVFITFFAFAFVSPVFSDDRLRIVATLSTFADLAKTIGGDRVEVTSIASPRFNPHFIEPKPSDVLKLKRADLFIHSGLDLEAWQGPLVDASARSELRKNGERQLDLSQGIELLEVPRGQPSRAEGDIHLFGNPHYWLSPTNGLRIATTIAVKLSELDPSHKDVFATNLNHFQSSLSTKMEDWKVLTGPFHGQKLIGYHNEWSYLIKFMDLMMDKFLEPKPGIPPSPSHIASLIEAIEKENIKAIVQPTFYSKDAAEEIAEKTGIKIITACQNVGEIDQVNDYISLIDFDIRAIVEALKP